MSKRFEMLEKRELAKLLFNNMMLQKDICTKVVITPRTLQKWIEEGNWKELRAAKEITKPELVNKILAKIALLIDATDESNIDGLGDKLAKLANTIEKLDKKTTVIDGIEVFMQFNTWLQSRSVVDPELSSDIMKAINKFQDIYITERISNR
jgi:hypothetical protein